MPLTNPNDFPPQGGINPRDDGHVPSRKPPLKVYLKPLSQKVIEKNLWIEVIAVLLATFIGLAELIGRELSNGVYFAFGVVLTVLVTRFIHIEDETHKKAITSPELPEDKSTQ